eukprot:14879778-Heterocapsa_arctica.AAC.1
MAMSENSEAVRVDFRGEDGQVDRQASKATAQHPMPSHRLITRQRRRREAAHRCFAHHPPEMTC